MTITVNRDRSHKMRHVINVRQHSMSADEGATVGGEDLGVTPHELYDSALGSCKAMTVLWYANRKGLPLGGPLTEAQRQELLAVADKCPVQKLMTKVTTEITTELAAAP